MSERWLREELADAVTDEPPLWLDLDEVVAAGRRRTQRRRVLFGAAALTAAVAALATVLPVVLTGDGSPPAAAGPAESPTPADRAPDAPWPGHTGQPAEYTFGQYLEVSALLQERLSHSLHTVLADQAEDWQAGVPSGNAYGYQERAAHQSWRYTSELTGPDGRYTLEVTARSSALALGAAVCPDDARPRPTRPAWADEPLEPEAGSRPAGLDECLLWAIRQDSPWSAANEQAGHRSAGLLAGPYRRITATVWGPRGAGPLTDQQLLALCRDLVAEPAA